LKKYKELMDFEIMPSVETLLGYEKEIPSEDYFVYPSKISTSSKECGLEELIKFTCSQLAVTEAALIDPSRNHQNSRIRGIITLLAKELKVAEISHCAKYFNRSIATLSQVTAHIKTDESNQVIINELIEKWRQA
jgi:hypothetical protein